VQLGGVLIDQVDLAATNDRIRCSPGGVSFRQAITVNLDSGSIARRVWWSKLKGRPLPERVSGVELVDRTRAIVAEEGQSALLLGAREAQTAGERLLQQHPGLQFAGAYSLPFGAFSVEEDR
jgi:UDP-N-acetyl-D-mannosaminuronic acid transferase (WecB/TagA/CpsF family)